MMSRFLLVFWLCSIFACASEPEGARESKDAEAAIRATFQAYKTAIQEKNGPDAVALLDKETREYYENLLHHIRSADSATIATLRLTDKVTLLTMRHYLSPEEIWTFDADALLAYAVEEGLLGREGAAIPSLDKVEVEGSWAKGIIEAKGNIQAVYFQFNLEKEDWKMSLIDIFNLSDKMFEKAVANSGMQEEAFVRLALERMMGERLRSDIFQPVPRP